MYHPRRYLSQMHATNYMPFIREKTAYWNKILSYWGRPPHRPLWISHWLEDNNSFIGWYSLAARSTFLTRKTTAFRVSVLESWVGGILAFWPVLTVKISICGIMVVKNTAKWLITDTAQEIHEQCASSPSERRWGWNWWYWVTGRICKRFESAMNWNWKWWDRIAIKQYNKNILRTVK